MAIIKKTIKCIGTAVGEALVVGGALGTFYVLGFLKGSDLKAKISNAVDQVVDATKTTKTEEEPATEQEAESTTEEDAPPIEVCVNNQPED